MKSLIQFLLVALIFGFATLSESSTAATQFGRDAGKPKLECWTLLNPGDTVWGSYNCSNCGSTTSAKKVEDNKAKCTNCGTAHSGEKFRPPVTRGEGTPNVYVLDAVFKAKKGSKSNYLSNCPGCAADLEVKRSGSGFECISCDKDLGQMEDLRVVMVEGADGGQDIHVVSQNEGSVPASLEESKEPEVVLIREDRGAIEAPRPRFGRQAEEPKGAVEPKAATTKESSGQIIFGRDAPKAPLKDRILSRVKSEIKTVRAKIFGAFVAAGMVAGAGVYGYQPVIYEGVVSDVDSKIEIKYGADLNRTMVLDQLSEIEVEEGDQVWVHGRRWFGGPQGYEFESGDYR